MLASSVITFRKVSVLFIQNEDNYYLKENKLKAFQSFSSFVLDKKVLFKVKDSFESHV